MYICNMMVLTKHPSHQPNFSKKRNFNKLSGKIPSWVGNLPYALPLERKYNHAYGQIEWLSTYIQQNPYICEEIFNSLKTMMMGDGELSTEGLQIKTIKEYEQKEHFPNFSKDVDDFRYKFVDKKCDVVGCAISGGMKKKKKSRNLRHRRRTMKKNRSVKF